MVPWRPDSDHPTVTIRSPGTGVLNLPTVSKVRIYLNAGVEEVWVIDHKTRSIEVWTAQGTTTLDDTATLSNPLLPGFGVSVRFLLDG